MQPGFQFAFQMLFVMFTREVPWNDIFKLWETLWAHEQDVGQPLRVHMTAAILTAHKKELLQCKSIEYIIQVGYFRLRSSRMVGLQNCVIVPDHTWSVKL